MVISRSPQKSLSFDERYSLSGFNQDLNAPLRRAWASGSTRTELRGRLITASHSLLGYWRSDSTHVAAVYRAALQYSSLTSILAPMMVDLQIGFYSAYGFSRRLNLYTVQGGRYARQRLMGTGKCFWVPRVIHLFPDITGLLVANSMISSTC